MRRVFSIIGRNLPYLAKRLAFFTLIYAQQKYFPNKYQIKCWSENDMLKRNIQNIEQKAIKIVSNGQVIGYAYCFTSGYLITTNQQLPDSNSKVQYFLGSQKLKGSFRVIGKYQNLVFIQYTLSDKIKPIQGDFTKSSSYSSVEIIKKKQFINIKDGYFIAEDSGYSIVAGEGEIGSLVLGTNGVKGIAVQLGEQEDKGFMRIIQWKHLVPILNYVKGRKVHLGISVQSIQHSQGVQIVRIAPNSPLKHDIMMGDLILSANGNTFRTSQSLYRIFVESNGEVDLQVFREGKKIEVKVHL